MSSSAYKLVRHGLSGISIEILPAFKDNYMYMIIDEKTQSAGIVDPADPNLVAKRVKECNLKLTTVLTTHHHWDHASGNLKIKEFFPEIKIYGGDDRIEGLTDKVSDGDIINIGDSKLFCHFTPCHTQGHICYYFSGVEPAVFTGDTLFLGGCGRFFEGTAPEMHKNLIEILGSLPNETKVYCGHEYSLSNLKFGAHVEPNNNVIADKIKWCKEKRELEVPEPTVPSTIGEEKEINPFMRVGVESVMKHTHTSDPIETMKALRSEKDDFK
ncbi:hydroxyacylglutathione hydrolase, mitochondrial isoform X2 [Lepeophtheirus salmonis]|uniref:hydroxyacylglutathione hydrolase, mitochondrial isoform X2 n=1 Tax=Lepeophtheirus salmonis TaxID=72036 RepID=UPI001AE32091|nr:hydroxyacylglutathione hydrolase, mitochondrial-like isoform X2 [Lepeophtheirus salmonis]